MYENCAAILVRNFGFLESCSMNGAAILFTIQVVSSSSGSPVRSTRVGVSIGIDGVKHEYTDDNGNAHFDYPPQQNSEVYVDGKIVHSGRLEGKTVVYI